MAESRPIERIFVGSLIAANARPLGFLNEIEHQITSDFIQHETLKKIFETVILTVREYNLAPTPENIATLMIATGRQSLSDDLETAAKQKAAIVEGLVKYAEFGATTSAVFKQCESLLVQGYKELQIERFAKVEAGRIVDDPIGTPYEKSQKLTDELNKITVAWTPTHSGYDLNRQAAEIRSFIYKRRLQIENREKKITLPPELGRLTWLVPMLRKGLLYTILAPTAAGKSSLAGQIADYIAMHYKVAYIALEDDIDRTLERQTCRHVNGAMIEMLEHGDPLDQMEDMIALREQWAKNGGMFYYEHCPGVTIDYIIAAINRLYEQYQLDLVVIDYLQKVNVQGGLYEGYLRATEMLKQRAEEKGKEIIVFTLSQQSIDKDGNALTRLVPELVHKSQVVLRIQPQLAKQDETANGLTLAAKGEQSTKYLVHVDKNSDGGTGSTELIFKRRRFSFYSSEYLSRNITSTPVPVWQPLSQREIDRLNTEYAAWEALR
jgi:replicative DNA helicase